MQKRWFTYADIQSQVLDIIRKLSLDSWKPDYVVGITRGGLLPAVLLSHWYGVPMHTLKVSLRDGAEEDCDHNFWMAEDAYGYVSEGSGTADTANARKNILVVDDINDSGATINWIKQDWRSSCLPNDAVWDDGIWHVNVRFAVLVNNLSSQAIIDYSASEVNKAENDVWLEFPYENWWIEPNTQ